MLPPVNTGPLAFQEQPGEDQITYIFRDRDTYAVNAKDLEIDHRYSFAVL